jgi:hypothetical protein
MFAAGLPIRREAEVAPKKPKVYFEEWDDPLISGIGWVSELIEIAGGEEVFPELRKQKAAKDRIWSARRRSAARLYFPITTEPAA